MASRGNYELTPALRSFSQLGSNTEAVFLGLSNAANDNPVDTPEYFVRQHYLDFLNREPDEAGFNFWSNQMLACGADADCIERRRINVSAAYFLSIEFQQTGYLVYRMYKAAFGNLPGTPVPVRFNEFLTDTEQLGKGVIVNQQGWQQRLEQNKLSFANDFVSRERFADLYRDMSDAEFVSALNRNAENVLSLEEQKVLASELSSGVNTRAGILRLVAENDELALRQFNRAFVLIEYFGYLRRDPNHAPDADFSGYDYWLQKLNQVNGDFERAEMVKAFLVSIEYRERFAQ